MQFKVDDRCTLIGLKQRPDLNGRLVKLERWSERHQRWEVCFLEDGAFINSIRVKEENLTLPDSFPCPYQLDPCIGETLESFARGGGHDTGINDNEMKEFGLGKGQLTNLMFKTTAKIACEIYGADPTSNFILSMFLEYTGKVVDSELIQVKLKEKIESFFSEMPYLCISPSLVTQWTDMITYKELGKLMYNLRMGTLAFIEQRQSLLRNVVSKLKGHKLQRTTLGLFSSLDTGNDSISVTFDGLAKEIRHETMDGEITIIHSNDVKHIKVNPAMNQIYLRWLLEDVIKTLDVDDAKKGSLGKWHKLRQWEIDLTSRIIVSNNRMSLDVSSNFEPFSWAEGLLSVSLEELEDLPLVDADRRLLRLAFFSNITWEFAITCLDKDSVDTSISEDKERKLKVGKKVVVHSLNSEEDSVAVVNGMQGKAVKQEDDNHYLVTFTNLAKPQVLHKSNLKRAAKSRELDIGDDPEEVDSSDSDLDE